MKKSRAFLIGMAAVAWSGSAWGQVSEEIGLFADPQMTSCSLVEGSRLGLRLHMVHVGSGECRTASEFKAPVPECWKGATWVGDTIAPPFLVLGTTQGPYIAIAYTAELPLPVYLGCMAFEISGTGQTCCEYPVLRADQNPAVVTVDCSFELLEIAGGSAIINPDGRCPCAQHPLGTESSTWGRVKALYH